MSTHLADQAHELATSVVVVGTDGSESADVAVRRAAQTAAERGRRLLVVHGLDLARAALPAERLADWNEKYPDVPVPHRVYASGARKHPQESSDSAQMVVLGSHGWGGQRGLVLGSTGTWLVQHAHCPVMVAHPAAEDLR